MDTVEGTKGDSVLLTLLWRNSNFMLAQKLVEKTSDAVSQYFCFLKHLLGYEKFHELFPIILTDNGTEFSRPDIIENNHEYIRRFIAKGNTFDYLDQDDINLMLNHINSVKRDSLDCDNPYTLIHEFLPKKFIKHFDIKEIEQKNIILKYKLFDYKKKK